MVTLAQLRGAGLTRGAIEYRVRQGRLHPVLRGAYAVGHLAQPPLARETAAVLVLGAGVALSLGTAAAMWVLPSPPQDLVHVSTRRNLRSREGIHVHRTTTLRRADVRRLKGLPLTAPARTILDIEAGLDARTLERVVADALARRLVKAEELTSSPRLRGLLDDGPKLTRSEAERRLLQLIRKAGLPEPQTNVRIGPYEVDLLWPDHRVAIEVDGFAFHGHRIAFERDHRRDLALQARGIHTIRVTWRQIVDEPERLLASLGAALSRLT